jgi:hypothetical protein
MSTIFIDQPVYAKVMGRAYRVKAVVSGVEPHRIAQANAMCEAYPDLSVLTDTGTVTYLADKRDTGVPIDQMEAFRT